MNIFPSTASTFLGSLACLIILLLYPHYHALLAGYDIDWPPDGAVPGPSRISNDLDLPTATVEVKLSPEELRQKRLAFLAKPSPAPSPASTPADTQSPGDDDESLADLESPADDDQEEGDKEEEEGSTCRFPC
jgi:hypothetical protein